ncbi:MAG: hypothetical protein AAF420_13055 [Pseudomonadota bacterium]
MIKRVLKQFRWYLLLVPVFLLSAILQPAHTIIHDAKVGSAHLPGLVVSIGDRESYLAFEQHREEHGTELCGQCQFGFMGDSVQDFHSTAQTYLTKGYVLAYADAVSYSVRPITRNRDPPLS